MRLRILIASDHYPPFFGGAHRQTALLAEELSRLEHEVSVATVWHPGLPERESAEGVEVYRFKQIRTWLPWLAREKGQRHQPPFPDPVTITGLRRLIDRFKPDVIHSYGWISYSVAVALAGKDIPLLLSARDYGYFCATRSLLYENKTCSGPGFMKCLTCSSGFYGAPKGIVSVLGIYLSKPFLVRKTRGIHSVSQYVQRTMEDHLLDGNLAAGNHQDGRVIEKVIPSFLLPSEQPTNHHDFIQQLPDQPYILYVGGLQHRKGLDTLLSAYQKLNKPPSLVLVGYPSNDMPAEYPKGVQVFMNVPHANVMEAWDRSLFGVTPSLWPDPSPGVVREAMSRGKAVIVTSIGGSTEMINESSNGLLVPPGDANALAHAMQRLIDNPELREQLGKGGRVGSMQYMSDVVVPQFEQLYIQMVDGPEHENENHAGRGTEKPANKPFLSRLLEHLRSPLFFNGYALTLSSAATSIIGLLYWLLAARYYPAEVVGRNSAAIATILFLSGLAGLNLDGTLIRFIPRAGQAAGRLVGMVYAISILVALLVSPVYLLGIHQASGGFRNDMGRIGSIPAGCEETELCIRARHRFPGKTLLYQPEAKVKHRVPSIRANWRYFQSRCYAEGISKALVANYVGSGDGLASERDYTFHTLPEGVSRGINEAISQGKPAGLLRASTIIAGLLMTAAGYLVGSISQKIVQYRSSLRGSHRYQRTGMIGHGKHIAGE